MIQVLKNDTERREEDSMKRSQHLLKSTRRVGWEGQKVAPTPQCVLGGNEGDESPGGRGLWRKVLNFIQEAPSLSNTSSLL